MRITSLKFKNRGCFSKSWGGFESFSLINLVIGRNNTGKSQLLDLIQSACSSRIDKAATYLCSARLTEQALRPYFPENTGGGDLTGSHWQDNGRLLVDVPISWITHSNGSLDIIESEDSASKLASSGVRSRLQKLLPLAEPPFANLSFRRVLADRDIRPEPSVAQASLNFDGVGATNLIRKALLSSSPQLPRELIQGALLSALNEVFSGDGQFTEIEVQLHDEDGSHGPKDHWEVYLAEEKKGLIPLSRSGSGLKTAILVLLNLLVVPALEGREKSAYVYAFEELENNLHPALFRRLLKYIQDHVRVHRAHVFLTTHSGVALDFFGLAEDAQIVRVSHDGECASTTVVSEYLDKSGLISELGARPSELLQANGIVWVEGPSDRVYLNEWLRLATGGRLKEGRDYLCAFYGGSLLARLQVAPEEVAVEEFANLLRVNKNLVLMCDSDKTSLRGPLKSRVARVKKEVEAIPGSHIWITSGKEVENYLPGVVIAAALGVKPSRDPAQFEEFFPRESARGGSYVETILGRKTIDKMELATKARSHMTLELMETRLDWLDRVSQLVRSIDSWNA